MTETPAADPQHHPAVTIELRVRISGEWVTPEVIARTARELAANLARQLEATDGGESHDRRG
jgi:hypothetical protein